jgi:hypothetical protein
MSGVRYDGSSETIQNGLIRLISEIKFNNGMVDTIVINPLNNSDLSRELGSKIFYDQNASASKDLGTGSKKISIGTTVATLIDDDSHCDAGYAFGLTLDSWDVKSMGPVVGVVDDDGNKVRQSTSFAGVTGLIGYFGNNICKAPWENGRLTLPSLSS